MEEKYKPTHEDIALWRWGQLKDGNKDTILEANAFRKAKPEQVKVGDTPREPQEEHVAQLRFTFPVRCLSCNRECVCFTFGFDSHLNMCIECLEYLAEDAHFAFDKEKMSILMKHGKPVPSNKIELTWNGFKEQEARGEREPTKGFY